MLITKREEEQSKVSVKYSEENGCGGDERLFEFDLEEVVGAYSRRSTY